MGTRLRYSQGGNTASGHPNLNRIQREGDLTSNSQSSRWTVWGFYLHDTVPVHLGRPIDVHGKASHFDLRGMGR